MADIERKYDCPTCWGTGSMESSDSTDDRTWDCSRCNGTGKLADRRRPDPALAGAVEELREAHSWLKAAEMCDCEYFEGAGEKLCRFAKFLEGGSRD